MRLIRLIATLLLWVVADVSNGFVGPTKSIGVRQVSPCIRVSPLNGVAGCTAWLRKTFPDAFVDVAVDQASPDGLPYDHVYVDANDVMHVFLKRASSHEHLFRLIFKRINDITRKTRPRRSVTIAADGPGPMAKVLTQRRRRWRLAGKQSEAAAAAEGKAADAKKKRNKKDTDAAVSSLELTPGTRLMVRMDAALHDYARTRLSRQLPHDRGVRFFVSGPQVMGEGELKMLRRFYARTAADADGALPWHVVAVAVAAAAAAAAAATTTTMPRCYRAEAEADVTGTRKSQKTAAKRTQRRLFVGSDSDLLLGGTRERLRRRRGGGRISTPPRRGPAGGFETYTAAPFVDPGATSCTSCLASRRRTLFSAHAMARSLRGYLSDVARRGGKEAHGAEEAGLFPWRRRRRRISSPSSATTGASSEFCFAAAGSLSKGAGAMTTGTMTLSPPPPLYGIGPPMAPRCRRRRRRRRPDESRQRQTLRRTRQAAVA